MVNLPTTQTPPAPIQLVVNPEAGTDTAPLEITLDQANSLVVPALKAQGLQAVVTLLGEPTPKQAPDSVILRLTLAGETGDSDLDYVLQVCRDWPGLQKIVKQAGFCVGPGDHWLPLVVTAKGVLYGELIGQDRDGQYLQPIHVPDHIRQPLYYLSQSLLNHLRLPVRGCYLLQVGWLDGELCFDRLWPFPIQPALASLGVQAPDLFYAHYLCHQGLPLKDLRISGLAFYQELSGLSQGGGR